jgi:predicted DNA-binding protein (MmcQ/YjbR family)
MSLDWIRAHCLSLPHSTEQMQWGDDLVFKIGGKLYALMPLIPAPVKLSFKCTPEDFAQLVEQPGIIPAPYMARAQWIALETFDALPRAELKRLLNQSYDLVFAKLPKKTQIELKAKAPKTEKKPKRKSKAGP